MLINYEKKKKKNFVINIMLKIVFEFKYTKEPNLKKIFNSTVLHTVFYKKQKNINYCKRIVLNEYI